VGNDERQATVQLHDGMLAFAAMTMVFLSYSTRDYFFAELAGIKLGNAGIETWRDRTQLRAGLDWRDGIEEGISNSLAIIVAMSKASMESAHVTYEWAYALGKGKTLIPVKLSDCQFHPKLEPIQHLDFSTPNLLPWESLIQRIQEIEDVEAPTPKPNSDSIAPTVHNILRYLDQRGYQMVSFSRLRERVDETLTDEQIRQLVAENPAIFRMATLKGGKPGLAKVVP
jgi:hypothetical protein